LSILNAFFQPIFQITSQFFDNVFPLLGSSVEIISPSRFGPILYLGFMIDMIEKGEWFVDKIVMKSLHPDNIHSKLVYQGKKEFVQDKVFHFLRRHAFIPLSLDLSFNKGLRDGFCENRIEADELCDITLSNTYWEFCKKNKEKIESIARSDPESLLKYSSIMSIMRESLILFSSQTRFEIFSNVIIVDKDEEDEVEEEENQVMNHHIQDDVITLEGENGEKIKSLFNGRFDHSIVKVVNEENEEDKINPNKILSKMQSRSQKRQNMEKEDEKRMKQEREEMKKEMDKDEEDSETDSEADSEASNDSFDEQFENLSDEMNDDQMSLSTVYIPDLTLIWSRLNSPPHQTIDTFIYQIYASEISNIMDIDLELDGEQGVGDGPEREIIRAFSILFSTQLDTNNQQGYPGFVLCFLII